MQQSSKSIQLEAVVALVLVGTFVYRCFFVRQDQKVYKDETRENQLNDFGKNLKFSLYITVNTYDEWF